MSPTFFEESDSVLLPNDGRWSGRNRSERQIVRQAEEVGLLSLVHEMARVQHWMIRLGSVSAEPMVSARYSAITFNTTCRPFSARILGANSEPRYDSRLYRAFVAKSATAGGCPGSVCQFCSERRMYHLCVPYADLSVSGTR